MVADKIMDHTKYPKSLKSKTLSELQFIVKDANEAMQANPQNPNNSFYADEVIYAATEIRQRTLKTN